MTIKPIIISETDNDYSSGAEYDRGYLLGTWEATYSTLKYVERILGFQIPENDPLYDEVLGQVSLEFIDQTDEYLSNVEEYGYGNYDN